MENIELLEYCDKFDFETGEVHLKKRVSIGLILLMITLVIALFLMVYELSRPSKEELDWF